MADKDSDLFFEPSSIAKMASEGTSNEALVVAINSGDPYNAFWDIFHFAKELHLQTPFWSRLFPTILKKNGSF